MSRDWWRLENWCVHSVHGTFPCPPCDLWELEWDARNLHYKALSLESVTFNSFHQLVLRGEMRDRNQDLYSHRSTAASAPFTSTKGALSTAACNVHSTLARSVSLMDVYLSTLLRQNTPFPQISTNLLKTSHEHTSSCSHPCREYTRMSQNPLSSPNGRKKKKTPEWQNERGVNMHRFIFTDDIIPWPKKVVLCQTERCLGVSQSFWSSYALAALQQSLDKEGEPVHTGREWMCLEQEE